ncbi:beta-ketoacyl-ACP synthase II [bacterium]|nr:beta-ketoacyl-ACP synthase II [bacterium]
MEPKRVVVTGMGVVTSLGLSVEELWTNLRAGRNGISAITQFNADGYATRFAGEIRDLEVERFLDRKEARRMDRFTQLAMIAAQGAVNDSGIRWDQVDREQYGVVVGSGIGGMQVFEKECRVLFEKGPDRISPFLIPMLIPDIAAGRIAIEYGLKGLNYATVSACATSAHALVAAWNHIRFGDALGILAGGGEAPITPIAVAAFNALRALSTRNDDPEHASRPFDLHRDGFVMAEGSGVLLLEELEHARRRGAKIHAEIVGAGMTADAFHITAPDSDGDGASRSMRIALRHAGIQPEQIEYINAHGTSTPLNDKTETLAIKKVFGSHAHRLAVSSTKSMLGHLLGASGAVEAIATVLCIEQATAHPTINYQTPDPECDLNYVVHGAQPLDITYALSNSFGFGGHNVSLIFKKYCE